MTASNNFWQSLIVFGSFFNQLDWQLLTNLWRYEALMTSNKQLQANSLVIFLTNAVRVLLHVSHRKNMKFSVLHQFLLWRLGISLCITLVLCSFLQISNFLPGTYFLSIILYQMPIVVFQWRSQIENFNNGSFFSGCSVFSDYSIMRLVKLFIKFLCCIMLIVLTLLLRIYTVITFCKFYYLHLQSPWCFVFSSTYKLFISGVVL